MQAPKLHAGEIDISADLAARLIAGQFPRRAGLLVRPVRSAGTGACCTGSGTTWRSGCPAGPGIDWTRS
jgi:hypothetical protein